MPGYPIELDLAGKRVLVVGLGRVGLRKAEGLLVAGAKVRVVDPSPESDLILDGAEIHIEAYRREHLQGMCLVFAAGPPEINQQVVIDARAMGIWVNSASDPDSGDFRLPAVWRDGPVTLTVSTSGASPALAATLRDRAGQSVGQAAVGLASLLKEIRPSVIKYVSDPERRHHFLTELAHPRWLELWDVEGSEAVRRRFFAYLEEESRRPRG